MEIAQIWSYMIRISKIADYGTKMLLAMHALPEHMFSAAELAEKTQVSQPTVSKVLKLLTKAGLLSSQQGSQGGYLLAKSADDISLADIVNILDGEIAMTECEKAQGSCAIEADCEVKDNWMTISKVIANVLQNISLQQMCRPLNRNEIPLTFYK
jgi:FeS assembly SUF system regulator